MQGPFYLVWLTSGARCRDDDLDPHTVAGVTTRVINDPVLGCHWVDASEIRATIDWSSPEAAMTSVIPDLMRFAFCETYWYAIVNNLTDESCQVLACAYARGHERGISSGTHWYKAVFANEAGTSTTLTSNWTDSSAPLTLTQKDNPMIKLNMKREGGKLMLLVDAKELHDDLDAIGVQCIGHKYADRPPTSIGIADTRNHTLSTEVLLQKGPEYPVKFDLTSVYTAAPPSYQQLKKLCESAYDAARKVLEHYQPIDISVDIQKKLIA